MTPKRHKYEIKLSFLPQNIMRLDQIMIRSRQPVTEASFNFCNEDNIDKIFDWCLMQQDLPPPDEPDIMNDF